MAKASRAEAVQACRDNPELSWSDLARMTGVKPSTLRDWCRRAKYRKPHAGAGRKAKQGNAAASVRQSRARARGTPIESVEPDDRERLIRMVRHAHGVIDATLESWERYARAQAGLSSDIVPDDDMPPVVLNRDTFVALREASATAKNLIDAHPGLLEAAKGDKADTAEGRAAVLRMIRGGGDEG